ncbi:MAG TPA: hypothetical protein VII82_12205, partial [Polyangiaceae bacterium]
MLIGGLRAVWNLARVEQSERALGRTLRLAREKKGLAFAREWTFADLYEWAADRYRFDAFIEYGASSYSFNDMNRRANRVARNLKGA